MATQLPLNKVLVIDPSGELRDFLRFCGGRLGRNLQIVSYLWARGCPDESYDWTGFDLVLLEQRLHNPQDRGIEWLRAMRRNPAAPAIVLISDELTERLRAEAEHAGAAAVLNKNDLSPRRFSECLDQLQGIATPEPPPAVPETPRSDSPTPVSAAAVVSAGDTAPQFPALRLDNLEEQIRPGISQQDAVSHLVQMMRDLKAKHAESSSRGTVDLHSDLYSAGVVFYQMLTGTLPFASDIVTTMSEFHLNTPIPRLPPTAAALQPLIDGLLETNPSDCFQSAAEVLESIEWLIAEHTASEPEVAPTSIHE